MGGNIVSLRDEAIKDAPAFHVAGAVVLRLVALLESP